MIPIPQYEMGLGDVRRPVAAESPRAKRVKVIKPEIRRFDTLPDELRYQEWLRDAAWMSEVLS